MCIPPALEEVVLSALEKSPQDRPANAAEFREKLLATAERLGLEHAAITSSPNMEALRSVGKESPSGRLVIDISKLRESRAASSDATEITVVSPSVMAAAGIPPAAEAVQSNNHSFSRLSVPFNNRSTKQWLMILGAVAVVLVLAIALVAVKSRSSVPEAAAVPSPSATATVEPSPSPVVSPSPSPAPSARRRPAATNKNSNSKGNSVLKKLKKIFKNPF